MALRKSFGGAVNDMLGSIKSRQLWPPVRNAQRVALHRLKRYFLCQQDIANHQIAQRREALLSDNPSARIELVDVHLLAASETIALAGVGADRFMPGSH